MTLIPRSSAVSSVFSWRLKARKAASDIDLDDGFAGLVGGADYDYMIDSGGRGGLVAGQKKYIAVLHRGASRFHAPPGRPFLNGPLYFAIDSSGNQRLKLHRFSRGNSNGSRKDGNSGGRRHSRTVVGGMLECKPNAGHHNHRGCRQSQFGAGAEA